MIDSVLYIVACLLPLVAGVLCRFLLQTNPFQPIPTRPKTALALSNRRFTPANLKCRISKRTHFFPIPEPGMRIPPSAFPLPIPRRFP